MKDRRGNPDKFIEFGLHNWFHNDLSFVPDFQYLHHHHATEANVDESFFLLEDWAWLWHAHETEPEQPHNHEGWDWSWHEHGVPKLE